MSPSAGYFGSLTPRAAQQYEFYFVVLFSFRFMSGLDVHKIHDNTESQNSVCDKVTHK